MSSVEIPRNVRAALAVAQGVRNGKYPSSTVQTYLQSQTNHLLRWRVKCVASFGTYASAIPAASAASSRDRWRFYYHASTHAKYLVVTWSMALIPYGSGGSTHASGDPYAELELENAGGTVGFATQHFGRDRGTSVSDIPSAWGTFTSVVKNGSSTVVLTPDSDYWGTFRDRQSSRLANATVYEVSAEPDTDNGYLPGVASVNAPILDSQREAIADLTRGAWKRNGSPLWTWSVNTGNGIARSSATAVNIIDDTSTSVTSSTPGVKFALARRGTTSAYASVPVRMHVFGACISSGSVPVTLRNSSGIALTCTLNSPSTQWFTATGTLPAVDDKYDLFYAGDGTNSASIRAVTIEQYAP